MWARPTSGAVLPRKPGLIAPATFAGWNKSQHISEAEAKPGDLVFFEGTYDTPGKSHVGIYLGNGKMVSAGDPIKYADIHSSYWQKYLSGFGRLSK